MTYTRLKIVALKDEVCDEMKPGEYYIIDDNPCIIRKEASDDEREKEPLTIDLLEDDVITTFYRLNSATEGNDPVVCWELVKTDKKNTDK